MSLEKRNTLIYINESYGMDSLVLSDLPIDVFDPSKDSLDREQYQIGQILSMCFAMLERILKNPGNTIITIEDTTCNITVNTLKDFINTDVQFLTTFGFENSIPNICSLVEFIRCCSKNRKLCTINNLQKLHIMIEEPFNQCKSKWTNVYGHLDEVLEERKIIELLSAETTNEKIIMRLKEKINTMDSESVKRAKFVQDMLYKTRKSQEREHYTNYYEIKSIIDLLSACLQEIFKLNKCIAICEHCGRLFMPLHRSDTKYCSFPSPENPNKNCKEQVRLEKQIKRDNAKESAKMHKSIRTMYSNKYGERSEKLNTFLKESFEKREQIKNGELIEEEYVEWLKTFFVRKYKDQNNT